VLVTVVVVVVALALVLAAVNVHGSRLAVMMPSVRRRNSTSRLDDVVVANLSAHVLVVLWPRRKGTHHV